MRLLLSFLAVAALGAVLGLLAGWPFHFAGGWGWWAGGGAVLVAVAVVGWIAWDLTAHGNIIAAWLGAFAVAVLLAHPAPARADLIARQGADTVLLTDAACTNEAVLQMIAPRVRDQFHAATAVIGGKQFEACWRPLAGFAHMVYDDADEGLVPAGDLQPLRAT